VPVSVTWVNGRLELNFLSEPPDKTNVFSIEKDVVLDSALARSLGYDQVTLKAGDYPVDYSTNPNGQVSPDASASGIVITVEVGRPSRNCSGFGICSITTGTSLTARGIPAAATWVNGRLQLNFLAEPPDKTNVFSIEKDVILDSATARALGYDQVTLKAGDYPVDSSVNPNGQFSPDVATRGIVIHVQIGRPSLDCTAGFGICSITIGTLSTARSVPALATWTSSGLHLSFLDDPPDKTNVLTVEKDIVLDSTIAAALGAQDVTLRAGAYALDTSTNAQGELTPDSSAQQLTITQSAQGTLTLAWPPNAWTLQEADSLDGPWTNSATQTSPLTVTPTGGRKFYRLTSP
jgi:hypothetical protein